MRISDWSSDVCSSDLFADARRGIVVRAVTRAEIAAEIAARLALGRAERDAAQVGAAAERAQPAFLAGLCPPIDRLRIAQIAEGHLLRRINRSERRLVGKSVSVRVDVGGGRHFKKKKK